VLSASLVGYAFSRFRFPGRDLLFAAALATMILPIEVTLIPQYILFSKLKWIDTYRPLIIPHWFGGGAFFIFLMRQFIMSLPRDLDEAAMIDGAGPFTVFARILMPLCVPVLVTVTVLSFIGSWNNFMEPLIYLNTYEKLTVSVGVHMFRSTYMMIEKPSEHLLMTAATIATLPTLLLFAVAQRYFVRGIAMTGLKGAGV
jgi:multiple sugar transport system permease protein